MFLAYDTLNCVLWEALKNIEHFNLLFLAATFKCV